MQKFRYGWHIYEIEILEQTDRQSASENVNVLHDAAANSVNEFVTVTANLDAAAHAENIIINVDDN